MSIAQQNIHIDMLKRDYVENRLANEIYLGIVTKENIVERRAELIKGCQLTLRDQMIKEQGDWNKLYSIKATQDGLMQTKE